MRNSHQHTLPKASSIISTFGESRATTNKRAKERGRNTAGMISIGFVLVEFLDSPIETGGCSINPTPSVVVQNVASEPYRRPRYSQRGGECSTKDFFTKACRCSRLKAKYSKYMADV